MKSSILDHSGNELSAQQELMMKLGSHLRVATPGIVTGFDADTQTATIQPAIREKVIDLEGTENWVDLPLLLDVPIVMPRAGGFVLTLPVQTGDECLVVFADMCIDAWWQSGGVQNQADSRRHDLSDAFAVLGPWSQQRLVPDLAADAAELRSLSSDTKIRVSDGALVLAAGNAEVSISGSQLKLSKGAASIRLIDEQIEIEAPTVKINGQVI